MLTGRLKPVSTLSRSQPSAWDASIKCSNSARSALRRSSALGVRIAAYNGVIALRAPQPNKLEPSQAVQNSISGTRSICKIQREHLIGGRQLGHVGQMLVK